MLVLCVCVCVSLLKVTDVNMLHTLFCTYFLKQHLYLILKIILFEGQRSEEVVRGPPSAGLFPKCLQQPKAIPG